MKRRVRRKKKQRTTICLTVFVLGITLLELLYVLAFVIESKYIGFSNEELLVEYMNSYSKAGV